MVFCRFRFVFSVAGKFIAVFLWDWHCILGQFDVDRIQWNQTKARENWFAISQFFGGSRSLDSSRPASFTIEATMVLSIVFMTVAALLQHAYIKHDIVTGMMILEEMLEKARGCGDSENEYRIVLEEYEEKGNPRLWLGTYELSLDMSLWNISGSASAGGWNYEMERGIIRPGEVLRQMECLKELQNEEERGNGGT